MLQGEVCEAGRAQHRAERQEVALIGKIHSVFILGMVVMGWGRGRGYGMSLHFITAWALALSFGTCHESKESLALITSHKYCIASDFRDGWQQARNYNELLQKPSSHKLQLFFSEPARLPTSGFWFRRYGWVFMCLVRDTYILSSLLDPFTPFSPHCLPGWRGGGRWGRGCCFFVCFRSFFSYAIRKLIFLPKAIHCSQVILPLNEEWKKVWPLLWLQEFRFGFTSSSDTIAIQPGLWRSPSPLRIMLPGCLTILIRCQVCPGESFFKHHAYLH